MTNTAPRIDAERWRAVALSWRVWLCEVLVWLAECFGADALARKYKAELRRDLSRTERGLRHIVVLLALARMDWSEIPGRPRTMRPSSVVRHRASDLRGMGRILRFNGRTLRDRIARVQGVIDDLDAHVARMMARLGEALRQLGPVVIGAAVAVFISQMVADLTPVDSS